MFTSNEKEVRHHCDTEPLTQNLMKKSSINSSFLRFYEETLAVVRALYYNKDLTKTEKMKKHPRKKESDDKLTKVQKVQLITAIINFW